MMRKTSTLFRNELPAALLLIALPLAGSSADSAITPAAAIESRQQGFKKMGAAMKTLSDQAKSATPDLAKMASAAQAIAASAPEQFQWFPASSGPDSGLDTDALAHIWKDRDRFDSLSQQLIQESRTLESRLAASDTAAIQAQVKVVGQVCASCHKSFRAD